MNVYATLIRKDWRQHRTMRLLGVVLSALVTPLLPLAAEATVRGWLLVARLQSYDLATVMFEAVPLTLVGLWTLLALLVYAHVFCDDAARGTERLLGDFPIAPRAVWLARLVSATLIMLTIALAGVATWIVTVTFVLGDFARLGDAVRMLGIVAPIGIASAALGVIASSAVVKTPSAAALSGAFLVGAPWVAASVLGSFFPAAAFGPVPIGMWWPLVFAFPALAIAGYRASCVGEPAGKMRVRRWLYPGVVATVACGVLFAPVAAFAVKRNFGIRDLALVPVRDDLRVLASGEFSVDASVIRDIDGEILQRFRGSSFPQVDREGRYVAVVEYYSALGRRSGGELVVWDAEERREVRRVSADEFGWDIVLAVAGIFEGLVWVEGYGDREHTHAAVAVDGSRPLPSDDLPAGRYLDGTILVGRTGTDRAGWGSDGKTEEFPTVEFRRFDPVSRRILDDEPVAVEIGTPTRTSRWLSRSGRYWLRADDDRRDSNDLSVVDLETGDVVTLGPYGGVRILARWLGEDRLVWYAGDGRLLMWSPDDADDVRVLGRNVPSGFWESPDGGRFIVTEVLPKDSERLGPPVVVYDVSTDRCLELPREGAGANARYAMWAGPNTIGWAVGDAWRYQRIDDAAFVECMAPLDG